MRIFLIILLIYLLLNGVVLIGMFKYLIPKNFKVFFGSSLLFLTFFQFIYQFFSKYFINLFSYRVNQIISYIVYYYMGFIIYTAGFFILAFIITQIFKGRLEINLYKVSFILTFVLLAIGTYFKHSTTITKYEIESKGKFLSPLKIVLISDIHLGYINGNNSIEKLTKEINKLTPDTVLIAGDLIDSHLLPVLEKNMLDHLKNIDAKYGVYFSLGNHDIYGGKVPLLTKKINSLPNVKLIRDDKILVDNSFYIASRDNFSKKPIKDILEGSENKPIILMQHTPDTIDEAVENKVFLQVSGHTHKGQIFPGRFFTQKIFKVDYGYRKIEDTSIIVSQGYGTWGPPIRLGSRSEIVLIEIK